MDTNTVSTNHTAKKIEDIIDIQKANGNFSAKQVAFDLPTDLAVPPANIARSLESGLSKSRTRAFQKKKLKKLSKAEKNNITDVVSWPSDSDITVLRMKIRLKNTDKDKVGTSPGDGLHHPETPSMVNLATLMRPSQTASKQSIIEEYLLPLTSWQAPHSKTNKESYLDHICCGQANITEGMTQKEENTNSEGNTKSKIARFLRLYFCPCCRCLYKMENLSDNHSTYWEKRWGQNYQDVF